MRKIVIAQIGTSANGHGNSIFASLKKQKDIFDIAGYALPENEREKFPGNMAEFDGYREMTVDEILADPRIEAVAVETEELYLTDYALKAARAGKHVHMEKPGGVDLGRFEELIAEVSSRSLTFGVGYMYRFNPMIRSAIERARSGELGEIYSVEAHMDCMHGAELRRWLAAFPGGMMFYLGCHLIDMIYRIQGEPEDVVPFNCSVGAFPGQDYGMAVLRYKNGVSFAKTCAAEYGGFLRRGLVICGTKGTIELRPLERYRSDGTLETVMTESFDAAWHTPGVTTVSEGVDRYDEMMRNFALIVAGERQNPYTYDYELGLRWLLQKCCAPHAK